MARKKNKAKRDFKEILRGKSFMNKTYFSCMLQKVLKKI